MSKFRRIMMANPQYWTCLRCGTTNVGTAMYCKECKNRRPY